MNCVYCNKHITEVVETRESTDGLTVRRRRFCPSCDRRFTTYEKAEKYDLIVEKKDGTTEPFDKEKIRLSFSRACKGRNITDLTVIRMTNNVEKELLELHKRQLMTKDIAKAVLKKLYKIDEVAFIRFASYQYAMESVGEFENVKSLALKEIRS